MQSSKYEELLKEKLTSNEEIGNTKLKEIYNSLSEGKEEIKKETFLEFFKAYLDHFKFPIDHRYTKYDQKKVFKVKRKKKEKKKKNLFFSSL